MAAGNMSSRRWIAENTALLSCLMIAVGVVLILLSEHVSHRTIKSLVESFGILFASVFFVSFLYEKFLAEKHFSQFRNVMRDQLLSMNNVQSTCARLGIREIFGDRNTYERHYSLADIFAKVKRGGRVLVVARTMMHLLNKSEAIKSLLFNGAHLELVCVAPGAIDPTLAKICFLKLSDIRTPLEILQDLQQWAADAKPQGSLELRAAAQPLPDSFILAELEDRDLVIWDLTFGRDLIDKRVFLLEPSKGNLGMSLVDRYETVFASAEPCLRIEPGGAVSLNELTTIIQACR